CYAPDYEVTKSDIDKFLSETSRKVIDHRLLIATTDMLGANARKVCEGQEKPVVRYLLSDFEKASVDYPESLAALATGKRKAPPQPRPYQIEAIENVVRGFETVDRGQLLMACGTGKTLVSMWIKERLDARRTLVLVPSLGLLSQIVSDWTSAANTPFDVLCVCSDQTVGKREEDEAVTSVSELPFPVTGDQGEIARFIKGDGNRVVFSTYQSSPLIQAAQQDPTVPSFDLILADEAHRCAGKVDGAFATVLDGKKLRGAKRLFATATPRTYSSSLKAKAGEVGVEVVGMDDEAVFGKPLHTLSFGEAIERNLLTDYQVVIVGVDDAMIAEWIKDRKIVGTDTGIETDAQSLATQIGLIKAIKDYGLQRIISFHNRVKRAAEFAQDLPQVLEWLDPQHKPSATINADHVSGAMSAIARRQKLSRLKQIGEGEVGILANARCLSEGVDVPALDGVAFVDPRSSQIDIVQAVGRAIRLSKDKTKGTIIIPVFIEQSDDPEQAILSSNFKPLWQILDALKAHDDVLSSQLDTLRAELGRGGRSSIGAGNLQKVVFDMPATISSAFADGLRSRLVERATESWFWWLGLLQRFKVQFGHLFVPMAYVTESGHRLGQWVAVQRRTRQDLSSSRQAMLDAEGFVWDVADEKWNFGYERLKEFFASKNTSVVPQDYSCDDGYELGVWVSKQRLSRQTLSAAQLTSLEELNFVWNVTEANWEQAFLRLEKFVLSHGHANVPFEWSSPDGFRLGRWVGGMRGRSSLLTPAQIMKLDKVGFVWDAFSDKWSAAFDDLKAFSIEQGHCRVPQDFVAKTGLRLGRWVSRQRQLVETMSPDKRARLDGLGFVWNVAAAQWDDALRRLRAFAERAGHCRVPALHKSDDHFRLGEWVREQRANRELLSEAQVRQLNELGFVWSVQKD
ncbi:MAG: Helicase associated domain protein, partial [Alphaproteobacteria bacterium]